MGQWSRFREEVEFYRKRMAHNECGITSRTKCCWNSQKVDIHPTFRATTPLSRCKLKSKGHGKLSIHFAVDQVIIEIVFRIIVSASQLNLQGTIANMCEEYESLRDRLGQPDVVMGRSIVRNSFRE